MTDSTSNGSPSVDEVIRILRSEVQVGSGLPIGEEGLEFLATYRKSIEERLQDPDSWRREGGAVRHAARQLGVIASAIAALHRKVEVSRTMIDDAARLVEQNCSIGGVGPRGRWCGREDAPDPEPGS